jgi:hypothetical protein
MLWFKCEWKLLTSAWDTSLASVAAQEPHDPDCWLWDADGVWDAVSA